MENGVLRTEEVYRFPNSVQRVDGHLEWDIDSLFANVKPHSPSRESVKLSAESTSPAPMCRKSCFTPERCV